MIRYLSLATILATTALSDADERKVPKVSLGGGYAFLRDAEPNWSDENFPRGFWLYGSVELGHSVAIAGEYSSNFKTFEVRGDAGVADPRTGREAFALGPRIRFRPETRWSPFVHALAGVYEMHGKSSHGSWSETHFMLQPGGGIDVRLHERLSLRAQVDLRTIFQDREVTYQLRLAAGAAVHVSLEPPEKPTEAPRLELGGGYAVANDDPFDGSLRGIWLSAAVEVHPHLAIAGEYSRVAADYWQYVSAFMVGPQLPFAIASGRVTTFTRFLVGRAERQYSCGDCSFKTVDLAIQPGGGIDVSLAPPLAARFALDYRVILEKYQHTSLWRFTAGIVLRFGRAP